MTLRVCHLSDTHERHEEVTIPDGMDAIIHTGDATNEGDWDAFVAFFAWLGCQKAARRIYVPGNHDIMTDWRDPLDLMYRDRIIQLAGDNGVEVRTGGCFQLGDEWVMAEPFSCEIPNNGREWDWCLPRKSLEARWLKRIQAQEEMNQRVTMVITHGPPWGVCDLVGGVHVGCTGLLKALVRHPSIRTVLCGHIHEGYGLQSVVRDGYATLRISNAALLHGTKLREPRVLWV